MAQQMLAYVKATRRKQMGKRMIALARYGKTPTHPGFFATVDTAARATLARKKDVIMEVMPREQRGKEKAEDDAVHC